MTKQQSKMNAKMNAKNRALAGWGKAIRATAREGME